MSDPRKTYKISAYVDKETRDAFENGELVSNNGLRTKDGAFNSSQPEFGLEDNDPFEDVGPYNYADTTKEDDAQLDPYTQELAEALGTLIGTTLFVLGEQAIEAAKPHVESWWNETAFPGIKQAWCTITGKSSDVGSASVKDNGQAPSVEINVMDTVSPDKVFDEVDAPLEEYNVDMTSEEAQRHLITATWYAVHLAAELRQLSSVCIKENGELPENAYEWQRSFERLATRNIADSINSILESNKSLLGCSEVVSLSDLLGVKLVRGGEYVPIADATLGKALNVIPNELPAQQ
jgi:hypothetical protein